MSRKKSLEEQIQRGLLDLAAGSTNDAVSLLFMNDEELLSKLPKLKLINVSEIKRPKGGGMEIKFFDRIKAFDSDTENSIINELGVLRLFSIEYSIQVVNSIEH